MSNAVLADTDLVADFLTVLASRGHLHSATPAGEGRWTVRRTANSQAQQLTSDQVEELVMDHLAVAFAARGLTNDDF
ncbi:hypothetical protein [Kitasatospora purpeofusca]|uniref:hypothetical protein n=1 Tax=Kitasatospora purpeofusca TaxID=67352 RepID=UPI002259E064|nr:hypothetical protein [Kitasatospora purpeofusca]MCX4758710.1 hypothetical protein [Kitasatospora purpeofusca]WSR30856.1 hypothetical protein OG715_07665 [Kitasatospora purpeofusca]